MAASKSSRRTKRYARLQSRTLNVSQSAIRKKWTKLPEHSQLRVKQLLQAIERSVQHKTGRSDIEVQSVTNDVASMLHRKLPRMPFPSRTEDSFFDYEATLNRTRTLEAQLTADVHSASLLNAEIEKERKLLEEDKNELQHLERALRDEEARRQRHGKGLHSLAKSMELDAGRARTRYEMAGSPCEESGPLFRGSENDSSLEALLRQLQNHLDSMQNNTASIANMPWAMTTSQSALDSFTWRCLDRERYRKLHGLDMTWKD